MKTTELRNKNKKEILELIENTKKESATFTKAVLQGKEKNLRKLAEFRKNIAKMHTVLNEMKILENLGDNNA